MKLTAVQGVAKTQTWLSNWTEPNWTETEVTKKRWQRYTEELYKNGLNDLDNHDDVITHLEPDILECGPYETLLQAKLVEVMEFQLSYFKS